jgi:hypothetical protein
MAGENLAWVRWYSSALDLDLREISWGSFVGSPLLTVE